MSRTRTLAAATAIAAILATPAFAQTAAPSAEAVSPPAVMDAQPQVEIETAGSIAASELIGTEAFASTGPEAEKVGEITDVVISADGRVAAYAVEAGGFLGVGSKVIAVPYADVAWSDLDGERRAVVSAPAEALKELPDFDKAAFLTEGAGVTMPMPGTDATVTAAITTAPGPAFTADDVMGASVQGPDGTDVGSISDVILTADGGVDAVVLDVGGFLGVGQKSVAVGLDDLKLARTDGDLTVLASALTKESLEAYPAYDPETLKQDRMQTGAQG